MPNTVEVTEISTKIKVALENKFVFTENIYRIIALAIASGKNVLFYGPAGHGKSEMVETALRAIAPASDIHIQSFGEDMNEAHLWGGLDFKRLAAENEQRYNVEESFLNKPYAILEELFDAPPSVLMSLKDTLTARK